MMDRDNVTLRTGLGIAAVPLPHDATYGPVRCTYSASVKALDRDASVTQPLVAMTRARDRILITITEGSNVSTALIGPDGHLFDFNLSGFLGGQRVDAGSYGQVARVEAQSLQRSYGQSVHVANEFAIIFPQYANLRPNPGDVVAPVLDETNKIWARYIYRGLAQRNGSQVAVLDLVTTTAVGGTPVIIGFSMVDPSNMAPVLTVVNTSSALRFERMSCR